MYRQAGQGKAGQVGYILGYSGNDDDNNPMRFTREETKKKTEKTRR